MNPMMSSLVPMDQFGHSMLPSSRSKKPATTQRYSIAEALKLKTKVTGQNEFVAFKRRGEKGRISAPGAETETWAKLPPERKLPFNQLAQQKNEAQRRVGKKELKDIIKNAVYEYIPDDDMRIDYTSKLIGEIKESCEQLSRVADLDVAFYTVGEVNQLPQDQVGLFEMEQGCYGPNMGQQDVKSILQDSIKCVTQLCTSHRTQSQAQMLEFKDAIQRASRMPQKGGSSVGGSNTQNSQMLAALLSSLMGALAPGATSSSSSSAASGAAAALATFSSVAANSLGLPRQSGNSNSLNSGIGLSATPGGASCNSGGLSSCSSSGLSSGLSSCSSTSGASSLNDLSAFVLSLGNNSGSSGSCTSNVSGCTGGLGTGSSGTNFGSYGLGNTSAGGLGSCSLNSSGSTTNSVNRGFNGLAGLNGLGSSGSNLGSLGLNVLGMNRSNNSGPSSTDRNRLDGVDARSAESLAQLKRSRPLDQTLAVPPAVLAAEAVAAAVVAAKRPKKI